MPKRNVSPEKGAKKNKDINKEQDNNVSAEETEYKGEETPDISDSDNGASSLETRVAELEEENRKFKEQALRAQADFENARKRLDREKQEAVRFANQQLLTDLVEVLDNFERALASANDSEDFKAFHEGIAMTENQFYSMLKSRWGLERIESLNEPFDPSAHRAMMMEDSTQVSEMTVAEELQSGYRIHDRVLRPALVKVFKPVSGAEAEEKKDEQES